MLCACLLCAISSSSSSSMRYTSKQEAEAASSLQSLSSQNAHASGSTFSFLKPVLRRELTRNVWLAPIPRKRPTAQQEPPARPDWDKRPTAHQEHPAFSPSCFHTIDECALIVDGFQFHRNQHREVERVRSYSRDHLRDRAVITNELTSFSSILMTLRADKVVSSARS